MKKKKFVAIALPLLLLVMVGARIVMGADFDAALVRTELGVRLPLGSLMDKSLVVMDAMGFSCTKEKGKFTDEKDNILTAPEFLSCTHETGYLLVCNKRTDIILLPSDNKIKAKYVSVGLVCL